MFIVYDVGVSTHIFHEVGLNVGLPHFQDKVRM